MNIPKAIIITTMPNGVRNGTVGRIAIRKAPNGISPIQFKPALVPFQQRIVKRPVTGGQIISSRVPLIQGVKREAEVMISIDSPQPRKRERLTNLSPEEKMSRRKMKNRIAAQTARDRKKAKMQDLEEGVDSLADEKDSLQEENDKLRMENDMIRAENQQLKLRMEKVETRCSELERGAVSFESAEFISVSQQKKQDTHSPLDKRWALIWTVLTMLLSNKYSETSSKELITSKLQQLENHFNNNQEDTENLIPNLSQDQLKTLLEIWRLEGKKPPP